MGSKKQLPNFWLKRSFTCSLNCLALSAFGSRSFSSSGRNCENSMRIKHRFPPLKLVYPCMFTQSRYTQELLNRDFVAHFSSNTELQKYTQIDGC